ncbi:hypothetical protein J6590_034688 [Homalodisca vitripennis]|nr:hypothetical protein J6590_034688 [Homalodisca vitripennis]
MYLEARPSIHPDTLAYGLTRCGNYRTYQLRTLLIFHRVAPFITSHWWAHVPNHTRCPVKLIKHRFLIVEGTHIELCSLEKVRGRPPVTIDPTSNSLTNHCRTTLEEIRGIKLSGYCFNVTAERYCPCKQPACRPLVLVWKPPLTLGLSVRGFLADSRVTHGVNSNLTPSLAHLPPSTAADPPAEAWSHTWLILSCGVIAHCPVFAYLPLCHVNAPHFPIFSSIVATVSIFDHSSGVMGQAVVSTARRNRCQTWIMQFQRRKISYFCRKKAEPYVFDIYDKRYVSAICRQRCNIFKRRIT